MVRLVFVVTIKKPNRKVIKRIVVTLKILLQYSLHGEILDEKVNDRVLKDTTSISMTRHSWKNY